MLVFNESLQPLNPDVYLNHVSPAEAYAIDIRRDLTFIILGATLWDIFTYLHIDTEIARHSRLTFVNGSFIFSRLFASGHVFLVAINIATQLDLRFFGMPVSAIDDDIIHPVRSLVLGRAVLEEAPSRHCFHVSNFEDGVHEKIKSSVCGIGHQVSQFTEWFSADSVLARPGHQLMDVYGHHIKFYVADKDLKDQELVIHLNRLRLAAEHVPNSAIVRVDGSVPKGARFEAVAAAIVQKSGQRRIEIAVPIGRATSADAELFAIQCCESRASATSGNNRLTLEIVLL